MMKIKGHLLLIRKKRNVFVVILLLLLLVGIMAISYLYWRIRYLNIQQVSTALQSEQNIETQASWHISLPDTSTASAGWTIYEDKTEGFRFRYPSSKFTLKPDSLEELEKREPENKSVSQNLLELKRVAPPKVKKALRFDNGDYSQEFYFTPFSLWIFDNPDGLTTNQWYEKYSYFPMLVFTAWGQLTDGTTKIDGQTAKYNYHRFYLDTYNLYLIKRKRIYLLHIERDPQQADLGLQILSTFKFID